MTEQILTMTRSQFMKRFLGVDDPCERCHGAGRYMYSHGSTWRGGVGTTGMEWDVCDLCWGTGDKHKTGVDLRKQRNEFRQAVRSESLKHLERCMGAWLGNTHEALLTLSDELERLSRGRKQRPRYFYDACEHLATALREMVEAAQAGGR